eukprot:CAMPEP_0194217772 /NCGR_PEP_ID=MMETSP0156-20130528/22243_1 /TAXON_ID=33649 /ORGANISM="Thalassionema nitzschioides, Strain L26-B" /LENGTH=564 /DNA_ID=CAMNT_0038946905 /DNA_START=150 /DNA_END=1844 /DNA_ORIENTATION=-
MFSKQVVSSRSRLLSYHAQHHQRNLTRTITSRCDETDRLLIIGSGVAGSAAALIAAETHKIPTTLVYAGSQPTDCNSFWAQGGIIYKGKSNEDSPSLLAEDIHRAGAGLCSDDAVQKVSIEGSERVQQLLLDSALGRFANVPFQRNEDGELSLCLEASHAAPRILYKADHTGRVITEHITAAAARHPLISALDNTIVTDLIVREGVCIGIETLHGENHYASKGVVLASGGLAGIYQHSTNPPGFNALGSSVAMACRAGVETKDLEYVQFHPTALNIPNEARFLLTEALRGEGAILRNCYGEAFAKNFHPDGELAPRDIVARGVFEEAQRTGADVRLDITHRDADWLYQRFPTISDYVQTRGFDLAKDSLPITPAAHYTCGGVSTDLNGCTSLPNLYAAGEAARTGLHGGNRLASTSLLEGLVFGAAVADYVGSTADGIAEEAKSLIRSQNNFSKVSSSNRKGDLPTDEAEQLLQDLKRTMWDQVGVVRTPSGLSAALKKLQSMKEDADRLFRTLPCPKTAGLRDASEAGYAVATSALANRTAKGAHFIVDDAAEDDSDDVAVVG